MAAARLVCTRPYKLQVLTGKTRPCQPQLLRKIPSTSFRKSALYCRSLNQLPTILKTHLEPTEPNLSGLPGPPMPQTPMATVPRLGLRNRDNYTIVTRIIAIVITHSFNFCVLLARAVSNSSVPGSNRTWFVSKCMRQRTCARHVDTSELPAALPDTELSWAVGFTVRILLAGICVT